MSLFDIMPDYMQAQVRIIMIQSGIESPDEVINGCLALGINMMEEIYTDQACYLKVEPDGSMYDPISNKLLGNIRGSR